MAGEGFLARDRLFRRRHWVGRVVVGVGRVAVQVGKAIGHRTVIRRDRLGRVARHPPLTDGSCNCFHPSGSPPASE